MSTPWMIDELLHAGPEHLDPSFVVEYDRKAGFDPSEDLAVLRGLGLDEAMTLVDLGAGTGRFALAAAEVCGRVVAVDISPAMNRFVRERAREENLASLVCVQAGFLSYEHDGPPADVVYTRNALHHLPDFWKAVALNRIAEMMRPRGVLRVRDLIYDFEPADAERVLGEWLRGAVDDPALGYTRGEFAEHIRTEHSTFRWLFEPMLVAAGFEIVDSEFRGSVYGAYTCVKR